MVPGMSLMRAAGYFFPETSRWILLLLKFAIVCSATRSSPASGSVVKWAGRPIELFPVELIQSFDELFADLVVHDGLIAGCRCEARRLLRVIRRRGQIIDRRTLARNISVADNAPAGAAAFLIDALFLIVGKQYVAIEDHLALE
jgi:hypothetical protein